MSGVQPEPTAPTWLMSLRVDPVVHVIAKAVHGLDQLTVAWRSMLWEVILVDYEAEFVIDEHIFAVRPGTLTVFPPGATCSARFTGRSEQIYTLFGLAAGRRDEVPVPCLTDLGDDTNRIRSDLETALAAFPTEPSRTGRIVYGVLRDLATAQAPPQVVRALHPALRAAVTFIEVNLHEHIDVKMITAHAQLSASQLGAHFRREFDTTIVGYVRRRRAERARKLLLATDLPVKTVAAQTGIRDLQGFNKMIRREYGVSPRALRVGDKLAEAHRADLGAGAPESETVGGGH